MLCLGSGGGSTGIGTSSTPCVGNLNIAPASLLNFTDILAFEQPSDDIVNQLFRGVLLEFLGSERTSLAWQDAIFHFLCASATRLIVMS